MTHERLSTALLRWYDQQGRKHLPWQRDPTPYRVWVSEIMLQQTQVVTVIDYFQRFIARFPEVGDLASADIDEVLHLWSGLGYYARARNLHRAARMVCEHHDGVVPTDLKELTRLPGIGRSTAGAVLALACGQRHPILDGNVKRVLCRLHAIEGWPGRPAVARQLWALAEQHTPKRRIAAHTQAIMDLGATVCTRTRPACSDCPIRSDCAAHLQGKQATYPTPKPRRDRPTRETIFIVVRDMHGNVLLEKRPPAGVWGGLWSFPECEPNADPTQWSQRTLGVTPSSITHLPPIQHGFTHFRLAIHPVLLTLGEPRRYPESAGRVMERPQTLWYNLASPRALGLAAPVTELLSELQTEALAID